MRSVLAVAILATTLGSNATSEQVSPYTIPEALKICVFRVGDLELVSRINPYYLRADFNRDKSADYAAFVRSKPDGEEGILICWGNSKKPSVLGAGRLFHDMRDLNFDAWLVVDLVTVEQGVGEGPPPRLKGDAIEIIWEESASAIVYWDGKQFVRYQQAD